MAADSDLIRSVIATYCEAFTDDRETWLGLFADDATVEDPLGSDRHVGKDAIGAFWDLTNSMADKVTLTPLVVKAAAGEGAFAMQARMESGGQVNGMEIIDVMTFDDDGKITSQRAFWDFADMAPLDDPAGADTAG